MADKTEENKQSEKLLHEATLTEYKMLREEMKTFMAFQRNDTHYLLLSLGTLVTLFASKLILLNNLVAVVPSVAFAYLLVQFMSGHTINVQAKACARIERRINSCFGGEPAMDWESVVVPKTVRCILSPGFLGGASFYVLLVFVFIFCAFLSIDMNSYALDLLHLCEMLVILLIGFLFARFEIAGRLPPDEPEKEDTQRTMITVTFPDRATEKQALAFLLGRFSGHVLKSREHLVPGSALEALADQNIPFTVKGKVTYEQQLAAVRGSAGTMGGELPD
jgi:hypothetical protein